MADGKHCGCFVCPDCPHDEKFYCNACGVPARYWPTTKALVALDGGEMESFQGRNVDAHVYLVNVTQAAMAYMIRDAREGKRVVLHRHLKGDMCIPEAAVGCCRIVTAREERL